MYADATSAACFAATYSSSFSSRMLISQSKSLYSSVSGGSCSSGGSAGSMGAYVVTHALRHAPERGLAGVSGVYIA